MRFLSLALIPGLLVLAACGSEKKAPVAPATGSVPAATSGVGSGELPAGHPPINQVPAGHPPMGEMSQRPAPAAETVSGEAPAGSPIVWDVPEAWTATRPANSMRVANFPLAEADGRVIEVVVFSLGGTADMNVKNWIRQLTSDEDADPAEVRETEINGLKVTRLDVSGTFGGGETEMHGGHAGAENYRMLAVAVEGGGAPLQVKLVGPADVVAEHEEAFDAFVATIRPAE